MSLEQIKKEMEELVKLYEKSNSFLTAEIQVKSQQLDQMIISYLKKRGEGEIVK